MVVVHPILGFFFGIVLARLILRCSMQKGSYAFFDITIKNPSSKKHFIRWGTALLSGVMAGLFWVNSQVVSGTSLLIFTQVITALLVSTAVFDLAFRLIPLQIVGALVAIALGGPLFFALSATVASALTGAAVVGGIVLLLYIVTRRRGIGEADIALGIVIGALFGWMKGLIVFAAANMLGLIVMLPLMAIFGKERTRHIPLVFFLVMAVLLEWYLLYSHVVLRWMGI